MCLAELFSVFSLRKFYSNTNRGDDIFIVLTNKNRHPINQHSNTHCTNFPFFKVYCAVANREKMNSSKSSFLAVVQNRDY